MSSKHYRRTPSVSSISSLATPPSVSSMGGTSTSSSATPGPRGIGLSDPDQSAYRRKILGVIDRMRATGVGTDIDLPMIAVIGSQSAGKSSLIESISGITLPRAAGTCTRCPTECRLSYSNQSWSCKVLLRKTVDKKGGSLGVAENVPFGPVITNKKDVEERIRRAQRAILNPSISYETFLSGPDSEPDGRPELTFSKNCVCLELSGPDLTDLSFCDLPGLIVSVSQGNKASDIELVRDLVESYIVRPSCLILLTVTCETDFENQGAHHLAKQHDSDGQRTIGVLTKPDRIPRGEEDHWLRFIRGEAEHLANGWFVVKQPATVDLKDGVTWEGAREREKRFFSTRNPWSLETGYRHRFGTHNLTESLSKILSDLIKRRLPELEGELQSLLKKTESQIRELPAAPTDDVQGEVILLVSNFARELATYVEGTPDDGGIHQTIRPLNQAFLTEIRGTAQKFSPYIRGVGRSYTHPKFLASDTELEIDANEPDAIYADEVMALANRARARELPGHCLYIVTKWLINESTKRWSTPSRDLSEKVYNILVKEVNKKVDEHFHRFEYGRLHQDVKSIVNEVLAKCQASASERINQLLIMENKAPSTLHEPYLMDCREEYLESYRNPYSGLDYADDSPCLVAEFSLSVNSPRKDPHDQAFLYMASARAYFQVAFKRFTDMVPMMIDQELLRGLDWERGLNSALTKGLGITGPGSLEKAKEYLQELPEIKNCRERLHKQRERLLSAKQALQSI
ncbi:hypothetical protein BDM02DRAFT_3187163 [Thelephora ganbajun]|uniref:Uncharacterized protein n=1 Tax=Thelephora ganbajun TaxID=370292 RepID=A0ACB6ZG85_THEGA|nr:hypothetical protein BDM02DRAFT_3187163 [Thelephora ganbajun]